MTRDVTALIEEAEHGNRRALARLISLVEDHAPPGGEVLQLLYPRGGYAMTTGFTGAPGAGKSTLVAGSIGEIRRRGSDVAVVAVDPSSPFTGGAILGDRVRMQAHVDDPGVYVRSMANRGHLGGIAGATPRVVAVLDALKFDEIIIETVGVGQAEVEVATAVDTTVVAVNPGWGDSVQAAKAGLLEIGDVFVVNKADRPGADETERELAQMLDLGTARPWRPPIVRTVAVHDEGVANVWEAVVAHRAHLVASGELTERRVLRARHELESAASAALRVRIAATDGPLSNGLLGDVVARRVDPWRAAEDLLRSE
jgi:LAO/AO transport system kinase